MIDWLSCESYTPNEAGTYLVVTAKGAVILDRWDGETWGRCTPRMSRTKRYGRYPLHRCWTFLPRIPSEAEIKRKRGSSKTQVLSNGKETGYVK